MPEAIQKYCLCETCLHRQGGRFGHFEQVSDDECFICRGLVRHVDELVKNVVAQARSYEFTTFAVGLSMPGGVQEREDELRSTMKMKGKETIKLQLSATIANDVSKKLRKRIDKLSPDLTMIVDLSSFQARFFSKPLFFYGRYTKPPGIAQRKEWCPDCRGKGCDTCRLTGFSSTPSVEAVVRKKFSCSHSDNMVFTWIGSEDKESSVLPPGRPFVVEIKNPFKRRLPKRFTVKLRGGQVRVGSGRIMPSKPVKIPSFRFRTRIFAKPSGTVSKDSLIELHRRLANTLVQFDRPYHKPVLKRVYRVKAKSRGRMLIIDAELDGGLPVKKFVNGELVSPSVSEVLKTEVRCQKFDIRRVTETSEFEFAEIPRI